MTDHDRVKLDGVHPDLVARLHRVLLAMEAAGFPMLVTDGVRTSEQQKALFAKGRTAPGPVVTNANGMPKDKGGTGVSNHQPKVDGFGHAADCAFLVNGRPSWDARLPWKCYGELAKAVGLKWGGEWTFVDLPHVELP
jgi:peptidoglycan L-alanyl-D-glutamate endopeptidase CwlK